MDERLEDMMFSLWVFVAFELANTIQPFLGLNLKGSLCEKKILLVFLVSSNLSNVVFKI